ncbi:MAG: hypothetical protein KIS87_08415 [Phycisphaeraceae bacterium]|nr:hypothetical protein [Phycisphaeraceae bacterium]
MITFLDHNNSLIDPETRALNVSNHVSDDGDVATSAFGTTVNDRNAFRIQVELDQYQGSSIQVKLRVGSRPWITLTLSYPFGAGAPGGTTRYRGVFHRLVTDEPDDAVLGNQTLLCKLRDLVLVRYQQGTECIEQAAIRVGRSASEDNNDHPNHLRHDVRLLKVNVVVFSRPGTTALDGPIDATATQIKVDSVADAHESGFIQIESEYIEYDGLDKTNNRFLNCTRGIEGSTAAPHADNSPTLYSTTTPVVSRSQVMADLATIDERFAQATIRLNRPVSINMGGTGDPGVVLPSVFLDGFVAANEDPLQNPTEDEQRVVGYADSNMHSMDIFYVDELLVDTIPVYAYAYYPSANATQDSAYQNFCIVSANIYTTLSIPHEVMHVLLNASHRSSEPDTALFYPTPAAGKPVGGPKRIGPYPDAQSTGVGNDDTMKIRSIVEVLHQ